MKKTGVINSALAGALAELGHTDLLVLADAGFPTPKGVRRIDLSLRPGFPRTVDVLEVVNQEIVVEGLIVAIESQAQSAHLIDWLQSRFPAVEIEYLPHSEFKRLSASAKAVVRSGDVTPYSNAIVRVGVPY